MDSPSSAVLDRYLVLDSHQWQTLRLLPIVERPKTRRPLIPIALHSYSGDDAILFMNGRLKTVRALLRFIAAYEQASSQKVNFSKSSFILPKKASLAKAHKIRDVTGFNQASFPCTYLDVPLMKGKIRSTPLLPLVHKILGRIEGWKSRILNPAAKMVLIKHVLSSILIHIMSVVNIPKAISRLLDSSLFNFFRGTAEEKKKKHWVRWANLCFPQ
ncbi:uncharacterized protein LOC131220223 [Magnolia sinica]|uniref:uncharacterized protein LOC131220223 n=1 Tax=Magnolia sinica TaxID=86752 RepID=UPI00265ACB1E|nr:uncharacterized protein LOC131220223 [Magnolia sinica]